MKIKRVRRTTELTIESSRFILAGRPRAQKTVWCPVCPDEARLVTPEEASSLARVSVREINRRVEEGRVHFIETREGLLFICATSLMDKPVKS